MRAWFVHQINGVVVVEYLPAPLGDRHPIGVSLAARSLGIPEEHWDKGESGAASRLARWTKDLLRNITSKCEAPYGAIGVEIRFATPSQLREGSLHMTSEVFVSRQLLTSHPSLERTLNEDYGQGEALDWPHGTFFSTWAPYNARRVTVSGIQNRLRRSELALGNAMLAHP
ncbi:MAG TPA: hypothetical protein VFE14_17595 [Micromonosporaceae bacterium]|nr:hypothetical protein [Micromonosporaceae bacterium]